MPSQKKSNPNQITDKRHEPRTLAPPYYSVAFTLGKKAPIYQFKLRDISPSGLCILVREDSKVIEYLEVGKVIQMTYTNQNLPGEQTLLTTKVRHITKSEELRYRGHFLVGLARIEIPEDAKHQGLKS